MRVAGNKLKHMSDFYFSELNNIYDKKEIESIFASSVNHFLGFSKTEIITKSNENINQSDLLHLYDCCKELKTNKPLQYILGETWFYDTPFYVNNSVLIPRPETEELVEIITKENPSAKNILDIGTGSGCIAISLKKNIPSSSVFACDISSEAISLAQKNALSTDLNVCFYEADILDRESFTRKTTHTFDVIVSNPPYIKESERQNLAKNVIDFEPALALFVEGDDSILFYKKIIDICTTLLNKNGKLYFELNPLTALKVQDYAVQSKIFDSITILNDMSGKLRFFNAVKI